MKNGQMIMTINKKNGDLRILIILVKKSTPMTRVFTKYV